jgi:NNP family nitrate/nitrite transporter-like MFS transporter
MIPLLFLTLIFLVNFSSRVVFSPLMPTIEADLGFSHSEAGSLFLLISLGYCIALFGSGYISARIMHRKTIILSSAAVGFVLLVISQSNGIWTLRLGLLVLGMVAGIYLPSGIASLTALIDPRNWGIALAVHELAPNLGFVAAPLLSEMLMLWFSWRGVLALFGAVALLVGLAFGKFGRGGKFPGKAPGLRAFRTLFAKPAFWIMMVLFSLGIGSTMGIFTMLPLYLVSEQGMNRQLANTLVGLSRVSGIGMTFLGGWATDRFGPKRTLKSVFLLTGILTILLGLAQGSWVVVIVFLQPMLAGCFFPAGLAALSSIGSPGDRNLAVSLTIPFSFLLGAGAIPTGIGILGDAGFFAMGFALVGSFIIMGTLLARNL